VSSPTAAAPRAAPPSLVALVERFDHAAFDLPGTRAVIRAGVTGGEEWDVVVERGRVRLSEPGRGSPDALLSADAATWDAIAADVARGMDAFRRGRLRVRRNLHLGVGFLAATSGGGPGRLRFRRVQTAAGAFSVIEAGEGAPVLMLHGLGGTKSSFLPSIRRARWSSCSTLSSWSVRTSSATAWAAGSRWRSAWRTPSARWAWC
jgi:hypothetical protein